MEKFLDFTHSTTNSKEENNNRGGKRDYFVDLLKFFMAIFLILYHINFHLYGQKNILLFPAGYRCVEVFFVVSGYYLFRTLDTHISEFSFSEFVIHRLTPLYPPYLSCYLLTIAFCISQDSLPTITGAGIFKYTYVLIDLLMMQNWGFSLPTCGDWFTSALVLASIIIFWLYKIVPSKRHVLFFSMIALLFSLVIFITHVNLQVHEARYHISSGVVRAIIGLSVGSVAYIYKKENRKLQ